MVYVIETGTFDTGQPLRVLPLERRLRTPHTHDRRGDAGTRPTLRSRPCSALINERNHGRMGS
eukprot:6213597-Pleurochrysis_carterae.AAC.1